MGERDYLRSDFMGSGPQRHPFWATAPGTKGIVIGLVAIHLGMLILRSISLEAAAEVWHALSLQPYEVLHRFKVWQLLTGALLHDLHGIGHIFWNCFVIYVFGKIVEQRLGLKRYLVFALTSALAASLGYLLFAVFRSDIRPMVGASGAAMGMVVYLALWQPHMTILLFFVFPVQLWVLAVIAIVIDLIGALSTSGDIANTAHLAGAFYGWVYFRYSERIEGVFGAIDHLADKRRFRKQVRRRQEELEMRREIDRILDKVNRDGMTALTEQERRFLKKASSRLRE